MASPTCPGLGVRLAEHAGRDFLPSADGVVEPAGPADLDPLAAIAAKYMPGLAGSYSEARARLLRSATCLYTMTPDDDFIVDHHPEFHNIVFAAGFSGHGFKFAPVIAVALADLVQQAKTSLPIGTFTDVSAGSGIGRVKGRSLGVAFNDYDGDGYTDIFVANDGMQQFLFHNNKDGTFSERALEAGVALSDDGSPYAGMGVDFRDYDNDGRPDLIITNLAKQIYAVYHNEGNGSFAYRSLETGIGTLSAPSSGWGVRFEDFDNDGRKDLFIAQGHVLDNVERIDPSKHYRELPLLAMNRGERFERADSGASAAVAGRGLAIGDLNNDGSTDAVIGVLGGHPLIFMNQGSSAHWLTISLRGTRSNRDGAGAIIRANGQTQYASTAGSYLSASDKRIHFGLGSSTTATIEVIWPSGTRQQLKDVPVDRFMEIDEPNGETRPR